MEPKLVGKYEVIAELGKGSMGVVYKARDPEIGREVAIKTLHSLYLGDNPAGNEAMQRFRQESRSAGCLSHPSIVVIFEAGRTEEGTPFIVMEYIDGKSIEAIIASDGSIEPFQALHFLAQTASAIDYAHTQNVIHRDIKPSNIIIDKNFKPHLVDFGVAKLSDTSLTPAGMVVGTPSYMAPEQIRGENPDWGCDLFAFAVVAYEMLTGTRPFPGKDFTTVVTSIIHDEPLPLATVAPRLPGAVEQVLRKGLAKTRAERYATALEFVDSLARVFGVLVDPTGILGGYNPARKWTPPPDDDAGKTSPGISLPKEVLVASAQRGKLAPLAGKELGAIGKDPSLGIKVFAGLGLVIVLILGVVFVVGPKNVSRKVSAVFTLTGGPTKELHSALRVTPPTTEQLPAASPSPVVTVEQTVVPKPELEAVAASPVPAKFEVASNVAGVNWKLVAVTPQTATGEARSAIEAILKDGSPSLAPVLAGLLRHEDYLVRVDVVKALAKQPFFEQESTPALLVTALSDKDHLVRGFAAKALAGYRSELVVTALTAREQVEPNEVVRKLIGQALEESRRR